ncbi:MAG: hypothetical protein R3C30_10075 [Hyphomonadaceae bacterium]
MAKKMLIDAAHPEETRVAVLDGSRVEDFDFEVASKKQLRGNIYLAKVTRVEQSLQAAFVEYGGNATASSPSRKSTPTITRSRTTTRKPSRLNWRRRTRKAKTRKRMMRRATSAAAAS